MMTGTRTRIQGWNCCFLSINTYNATFLFATYLIENMQCRPITVTLLLRFIVSVCFEMLNSKVGVQKELQSLYS